MNTKQWQGFKYWLLCGFLLIVLWHPGSAQSGITLVAPGSVWKYEDSGNDLGTAWRNPGYDDSGWQSGGAMLGFDENEVVTEITPGFITYYFRIDFTLNEDPDSLSALTLAVNFDDGYVAYLNGQEVTRQSMPGGTITYTTLANNHESGAFEDVDILNAAQYLTTGSNTLAIEVHQRGENNNDLAMDLELSYAAGGSGGGGGGSGTVNLVRGPYLQMGSPNSVVVRWRTGNATDSRVRYGTDPNNLSQVADRNNTTTEHEVTLSGLSSYARYYYAVGNSGDNLVGGADYFFRTNPPTGLRKKSRIWILGDSGTANSDAAAVRDAYYAFTDTVHTDLWVMLGDNAYDDGTDSEYQDAVFEMYPEMLRKSVLWPAFGNHDGKSASSNSQSGPFYEIFTLPANGESGGTPSGTEAYYSFDYGNIHFICLNSHDVDRDATGPMLNWVTQDLADTQQDWIIAFWHHPPYTKGSHDSDDESQLIEMRENALPILEAGGVDLVLSGHSHSYERSYLLDQHYGVSGTLNSSMILDSGDGRDDSDGPYFKPTLGPASHEGTVYVVAGSSGKTSNGSLNHPAMFTSMKVLGSVALDVDHNRLDAIFIDDNGDHLDYFTMFKGSTVVGIVTRMASFSGSAGERGVDLHWRTLSEHENAGFEVYRATAMDGAYERIGSYVSNPALRGSGNSSGERDYHYHDEGLVNGTTYWYKLTAVDVRGGETYHGPLRVAFNSAAAALVNPGEVPATLQLRDNYPNPFNPSTTIRFDLPAVAGGVHEVQLAVFDIQGRKVRTLVSGKYAPGSYALHWDATSERGEAMPSGMYIYSLKVGSQSFAKRMTLVR